LVPTIVHQSIFRIGDSLLIYYRYWLIAGRARPLQSEQTGKSRHLGDDSQVPEAEFDGLGSATATAWTGSIRGRIQEVYRTGPRVVGRTVDGRAATNIRSKDDRALRVVREEAE